MSEAGQFAVDTAEAPGRVVAGEAEDEPADLGRGRWASWSSSGMCPVSGDAAAVPAEQGVGGDQPACPSWAGERGGDRSEEGSIIVVECWSVDLAAQDGELVAEHDDLEVLGTAGTKRETGQRRDEVVEDARHS